MDATQAAARGHASPAPPLHPDTLLWPSIGSSDADYDSFHPQSSLFPLAPATSRPQKRHAYEADLPTAATILPKRRRIETEHYSPQPDGDCVFACSPVDPRLALSPPLLYDMGSDVGSAVGEPAAELPESAFRDQMMSQETMTVIDPAELSLLPQPRHLHRPTLEASVVSTDTAEVTGLERSFLPQPNTDPVSTMPLVASSGPGEQDDPAFLQVPMAPRTNPNITSPIVFASFPGEPIVQYQYGQHLEMVHESPSGTDNRGLARSRPFPLGPTEHSQTPIADRIGGGPTLVNSDPRSTLAPQSISLERSAPVHPPLRPVSSDLYPGQVFPRNPLVDNALTPRMKRPVHQTPWDVIQMTRADDAEPIVTSGVATADPCDMAADALAVPLMEHQKQGLLWMRAMEASGQKGGILADDMGLGKTVQALSLIVSHPPRSIERHATLVIAPAGLIQQWKHEIGQLLRPGQHQRSVYVHLGGGRGTNFPALNRYDIVLTTFGTVTAELRYRENDRQVRTRNSAPVSLNSPILGPTSRWHRVILDEAQYIKNDRSKVAIASCAIDATYRWCLSGTPVMNNLRELYSLLKFLRVQPYSNLDSFTTVSPSKITRVY